MTSENTSQTSGTPNASVGDTTSSNSSQSTPQSAAPPSTAPATTSAPTPESAASSASPSAPVLNPDGTIAPPAFQPNFKFKAFKKEYEVEEMFRGLIKDKETEEKVKKFHEKAYAMEKYQADSERYKNDFEQFKAKVDPDLRAMNHFNTLLKNKDWDNFFAGLKVPDDEIFSYVQKKLDLMKMDPNQRAEYDKANQARQQNYLYEQQFEQQQQSYQQLAVETRQMQLDSLLSRQDVSAQAEKVDQIYGEVGAFRKLVIEEAANHFHRTQQDLPAEQAVQMAMQKYGRFVGTNQSAGVVPQQASAGSPQPGGQPTGNQAPIIPHVAGSGRSPVKKAIKSLDDLKALSKTANL